MNDMRELLLSVFLTDCLRRCKLWNLFLQWTTWLGAVATLSCSIAMTKRDWIALFVA